MNRKSLTSHAHAATAVEHSLRLLRKLGFSADSVNRYNPQSREKRGLFGIFDIVAIKPGVVMGVIAADVENIAMRKLDVMKSPEAQAWVRNGNWIALHRWKRGEPRRPWELKVELIRQEKMCSILEH